MNINHLVKRKAIHVTQFPQVSVEDCENTRGRKFKKSKNSFNEKILPHEVFQLLATVGIKSHSVQHW